MKKETLLVLLIIVMVGWTYCFIEDVRLFIAHLNSIDSITEVLTLRGVDVNYSWIIRSLLSIVIDIFIFIVLVIIGYNLLKRERILLTDDELKIIADKKAIKKKNKQEKKLLQLNAKIEKLKNKDD